MLPSEGRYLSEAPFVRSTTLGECLDLLLASLAKRIHPVKALLAATFLPVGAGSGFHGLRFGIL